MKNIGKRGKTYKNTGKQGESGNIEKHGKTGTIKDKT